MKLEKVVEKLRERLQQESGSWPAIVDSTPGLDYSWLRKFGYGKIQNPTIGKLILLDKALRQFKEKDKDKAAA